MRDQQSFLSWTIILLAAGTLTLGCSSDDPPGPGADTGADVLSDSSGGNGTDATDATVGTDGTDETDGTDGPDGTETDGTDGTDQVDATEPTDGTDSTDEGTDGTDEGTDGTEGSDDTGGTDSTDAVDPVVQCGIDEGCADDAPIAICYPTDQGGEYFPNYCYCNCAYPEETGNTEDSCQAVGDLWPATCTAVECADHPECQEAWQAQKAVCAQDGTPGGTTFPNPYAACCAGYNWQLGQATPGACVGSKGCGEDCPAVLDPICGTWDHDGNAGTPAKTEQFGNSCELASCGATLECNAPCTPQFECPECASQGCAPVCGTDGKTYRNACYLTCQAPVGEQIAYSGHCCDCPAGTPADTVCTAAGQELPNACVAGCLGKPVAYKGPCVTGCVANDDDPPAGVCGFLDGEWRTFQNLECAELAGGTCAHEATPGELCGSFIPDPIPCKDTHQQYQPVCGQGPLDDVPRTFANTCHAGCASAVVLKQGICDDCAQTFCPPEAIEDPTPVCASDVDCVIYPNSCIPEKCLQYEPEGLDKNNCDASCTAP